MKKSIKSDFLIRLKLGLKSVKISTKECSKRFKYVIYMILGGINSLEMGGSHFGHFSSSWGTFWSFLVVFL
jgi:hypothetical protein